MQVRSLTLLSGLRIQHCCELQHRLQTGSEVVLLWYRSAAAFRHLAWEPPYAAGAAYFFKILIKNLILGVPVVSQWLTNPTRNKVAGSIAALAQWVKDPALP